MSKRQVALPDVCTKVNIVTCERGESCCDLSSRLSAASLTGFIPLSWSAGWVGSVVAAQAVHPAPPASAGWLLGVDGSRQARMKPTDCSLMVSARTSAAPACDARDPRNCSPIHAHIRPACPPSEHLACTQTHRLLCTLLTLLTYVLTGDTRQHCHRLQPLRDRA